MKQPLLQRLISLAMRRSGVVLALFLGLAALGALAAWRSPLDAIPDLSDPQVLLYARLPGSPEQIAASATAPMMRRLKAIPGVRTVRGFSDLGYSYLTAILEESGDQAAARRAIEAEARASKEAAWSVAGDASGVGWVYQYALSSPGGELDLYELRDLQERVLGPALARLEGVSEVAPVGGYSKRYEIVADPRLLEARGLRPADLVRGLERVEGELKGRLVLVGEREVILGFGGEAPFAPPPPPSAPKMAQTAPPPPADAGGGLSSASGLELEQLESLRVRVKGGEVGLGELALVRRAPDIRRGIADLDGRGECVGGIVIARQGVNALELIGRVRGELERLKKELPRGADIVPAYDRSGLILGALRTVGWELGQELLLVALVIAVFLGHKRSMLVLSIALPVTILLHFLPLHLARLSMNLMTLGGLAIAIGDIIDAGIVLVENGNRALSQEGGKDEAGRLRALGGAITLLIKPLFFTILVVVVSFLPVFALEGQEGRLFLPLAASKSLSMLSALAVTVLLVPALCARFLKGDFKREEEQPLGAWLQSLYRPSLEKVLARPGLSLGLNFALLALTVPLFLSLPREFLPPLNEGSLMYMPVTAAGVPAAQVGALMKEADRRLQAIPEVERVFGKAGRAESATDPAPLSMIESTILLKPRGQWRKGMDEAELVKQMDEALQFVGLSNGWTQPIRGRIDMQATGLRTPLGLKVHAPTLEAAERAAIQLEAELKGLKGVRSAVAERAGRAPSLSVELDEKAAARAGLSGPQVLGQVLAQAGGAPLTDQSSVQVAVVYPEEYTNSLAKLQELPIFDAKGRSLPLHRLAKVELRQGPEMLGMEDGQVLAMVYVDLQDRDIVGWVKANQGALTPGGKLGTDVSWEFSGQYEADRRASARLRWLVPLCLLIIVGLLALAFGSLGEAWLVMLSVPYALIGGAWIQWALGIPLSVSVWVGYIALFAVAVQTGVVMVVYLHEVLDQRLAQGPLDEAGLRSAVMQGAVLRLRPKLMTVATNVIGFLPLLWSKGAGSDLLASVAAPLVGGMLSSAVHVLYITPLLFLYSKRRALRQGRLAAFKGSEYL